MKGAFAMKETETLSPPSLPDTTRSDLVKLINEALTLADALKESSCALHLNDALTELSEEGREPPGWY
jgi:hypothetical protein